MATSKTSSNCYPNFEWAVPAAFADPLSVCRFEQGDTLYENESAYLLSWSEACKKGGYAVQVLSPLRGVTSKSPGQDDSAFAENWQSEVVFDLINLKTNNSEKITTTQGQLYSLLWHGDQKVLEETAEIPAIPGQAGALKKLLPEAVKLFQTELLPEQDLVRFFIPCDLAAGLYRDKYLNVKKKLETEFETTVQLHPAGGLGRKESFLPTVHVAAFTMRGTTADKVESALQDVLYKPSAGRKGVARFRLKTHGLLL